MNSKLFIGKVGHTRHKPLVHSLIYHVAYFYLDLDELHQLDKKTALFGYNKRRLFSFYDKDHGDGSGRPIKTWVIDSLTKEGIILDGGKIYLLTLPRMLGYLFNPISVYYCFDATGGLKAILYEVNNTFGERISYLLPAEDEGLIRQTCRKAMYVSPFFEVKGHYNFMTHVPKAKLLLNIGYFHRRERMLTAWVVGRATPFSAQNLLKTLIRMPFLTYKVIAGIHWEALKLYLKGLRPAQRQRIEAKRGQTKTPIKKVV